MRLFVAIELADVVRKSLVALQERLKGKWPDVRWTSPQQLHLTVKFLGEVADGDVPAVCEAVAKGAASVPPFRLETGVCGCFPERGAVRIVWVEAVEPSGALRDCVQAVEAQLAPIGFAPEARPFAAHVTIGRVREDRSHGGLRAAVEASRASAAGQDVTRLVLMSSELSPKGSTYAVVSRAKLGA